MNTPTLTPDRTAYDRVRHTIGFYDATTSFGRLIGSGRDVVDLLHRMSTGDLKPIENTPGTSAQTVLTNEKARIVDLLTVISREHDTLIITSAGYEDKVVSWLDKFTIMEDARFSLATATVQQFMICGPRALDFFRQYTEIDLISMPSMSWITIPIAGVPVMLQKSVRLAESGWQLFVDANLASDVKQELEARVLEMGGAVFGDDVYDILRIEAGIPRTPNELNEKHNPLETTLVSAVSFTKGCYIGQEVIARLDSYDKVQRHMMGLTIDGVLADVISETESAVSEAYAREAALNDPNLMIALSGLDGVAKRVSLPPFKIVTADETRVEIGELTSYAVSPEMSQMVGLAFIRSAHSNPGAKVFVHLGERGALPATLVKLPFDV